MNARRAPMSSLNTAPPSTPMCARARRPALRRLEAKALAVGTNSGADGGYLVPHDTETEIGRRLAEVSPIRAIAGIRQVSTTVYRKPFLISGARPAGSAKPPRARRPTARRSPSFRSRRWSFTRCRRRRSRCSTTGAVNIDEWLASEIDTAFAEQEGTAFVSGDGTNKPRRAFSPTTRWPKPRGNGASSAS